MHNLIKKTSEGLSVRNVFIDEYNALVATFIAVMTAVFGQYWYLFAAFMAFNLMDFATGWYKAHKQKEESSAQGLKGIIKKLWYWVLVLVAFIVANTFASLGKDLFQVDLSWLSVLGWFTLAALTINEARSIVENLLQIGVNVPDFLSKGLAITQKMLKDKVSLPEKPKEE